MIYSHQFFGIVCLAMRSNWQPWQRKTKVLGAQQFSVAYERWKTIG